MVYTVWAVFGLLILNFLIALSLRFWEGSFDPAFALKYVKDVLYYVLPLNVILSMASIDPTGWILVILFFVFGFFIVVNYVVDIVKLFRQEQSGPPS